MTWLRTPGPDDDKRSMGVLGVVTGSVRYPGAAVLGVEAAWRTGIGMVRLWAPRRVQDLVLARRPETICHGLDEPAAGVDAWLLGSGQDARERDAGLRGLLLEALADGSPCVLDAGALDLARQRRGLAVLTPHAGELARLLGVEPTALGDRAAAAARAAAELAAVVVAKGAPTHVATPDGSTVVVDARSHRLATAGTGDVLAGVLGALVAGAAAHVPVGDALGEIAAEGVRLHGEAAVLAADGDRPITALDVAHRLPQAVADRRGA